MLVVAPVTLARIAALYAAAASPDCPPIDRVEIVRHDIFEARDGGGVSWPYRLANRLHVRTRESVIRRELLFEEGDCLDPFLLAESERLLRGYGFLSRAEITALPRGDGIHDVIVDTQDDWSTRVDLRLRVDEGLRLEGVSLNEENLLGTGQRLGVFFFEREVTREYGLQFATPQLARTRWDLTAAAGRTRQPTCPD